MKRISKKVREEAALICDISASHASGDHWHSDIGAALGFDREAAILAADALMEVRHIDEMDDEPGRLWPRYRDAEAARMLRTGWSPS